MADLRPQHDEEVVAANHPTKADVTNRAWNVEHGEDGTHKVSMFGTGLAGGAGTPLSVDGIVEANGAELKSKVVDIGDWNMDTTAVVNVTHGLTVANIRSVSAIVRKNVGDFYYPIDYGTPAPHGTYAIFTNAVQLTRIGAGFFDGVDFNATSFNRGWITLWFVV